jgi:hypothetical protein
MRTGFLLVASFATLVGCAQNSAPPPTVAQTTSASVIAEDPNADCDRLAAPIAGAYVELGAARDFEGRSRAYEDLAAQLDANLSTREGRVLASDYKTLARRSAHTERDAKITVPNAVAVSEAPLATLRAEIARLDQRCASDMKGDCAAVEASIAPLRQRWSPRDAAITASVLESLRALTPQDVALRSDVHALEAALKGVDDSMEPLRRYASTRRTLTSQRSELDRRFQAMCGVAPGTKPSASN